MNASYNSTDRINVREQNGTEARQQTDGHQTDALCFPLYDASVINNNAALTKVTHTRLPGGVPELIPVLGSQPADDVSHKPGGGVPLLSSGPAVTLATLKRAATNFAAWQTEAGRV